MRSDVPENVVEAHELSRTYRRGAEEVRALQAVSFAIARGEFVAIVGPSGSGKTTLLNLIGCMDAPTAGRLLIEGSEVQRLDERARTRVRRERLGFVFQHFGLVPTLTVAENVALPLLFARRSDPDRVAALLEKTGLSHRRDHRPHELSGGEMQRVAIARALVNRPGLLLADEPTGNLDRGAGQSIIDLFQQLQAEGLTLVVVTHNPTLADAAHRRLDLADGRLSAGTAERFELSA
jgi:putative ABC transport system ATP-binding protein